MVLHLTLPTDFIAKDLSQNVELKDVEARMAAQKGISGAAKSTIDGPSPRNPSADILRY